MVCSNCHREIHDGTTEIPCDTRRFIEPSRATTKTAREDKCPICGKMKNVRAAYCSKECHSKGRVKVKWEDYDIDELLSEHGSYVKVGEFLGVSDNAVRRRHKV